MRIHWTVHSWLLLDVLTIYTILFTGDEDRVAASWLRYTLPAAVPARNYVSSMAALRPKYRCISIKNVFS